VQNKNTKVKFCPGKERFCVPKNSNLQVFCIKKKILRPLLFFQTKQEQEGNKQANKS
jgi:hypothetical protein